MKIRFSTTDCRPCPLEPRCTRSARRLLTLRRRQESLALEAARACEQTAAYQETYRWRGGIEGTISEGVRVMHLRRARYIGMAKIHLQHMLTATAINLMWLNASLAGDPLARTRQSAFIRLMT